MLLKLLRLGGDDVVNGGSSLDQEFLGVIPASRHVYFETSFGIDFQDIKEILTEVGWFQTFRFLVRFLRVDDLVEFELDKDVLG